MWSTASRSKHAYHTNNLHQRDIIEQSGDVFTGYGGSNNLISQTLTYNDRGEVTAAPAILGAAGGSGSALSNRQHEFDYDLIGNRKYAGVTGSSSDRKYFTANALNQYSSRDNSTSPFSGTQSFTYDDDGNVTDDGQWLYTWDAENRLVAMETKPSLIGAGISSSDARRLEFKYDYLHRRVEKLVRGGWNTGTSLYTTVVSQTRFVYDGWSLIAEYAVGSSLSLVRSYTWGLDIARSLTDAGGVGALLQIHDYAGNKDYVPAYDGNGNVTALFDVASSGGTCVAAYEYSPYGEPLRSDGTYATTNPIRFSTKYTDDETTLVYYGRRYYSPSQGRFLGRDPKQEPGGLNLYGFCLNNPINLWDYLGMAASLAEMQQRQSDLECQLAAAKARVSEIEGQGETGDSSLLGDAKSQVEQLQIEFDSISTSISRYGGTYTVNGSFSADTDTTGTGMFVGVDGSITYTANSARVEVVNMGGMYYRIDRAAGTMVLVGEKPLQDMTSLAFDVAGGAQAVKALRAWATKPNGLYNNLAVREDYLSKVAKIESQIDKAKSLPEQAMQAFELRNAAKIEARAAMTDTAKAAELNITDPIPTLQDMLKKAADKGLTGDDAWKYILESSARTRPSVNAAMGVKGKG